MKQFAQARLSNPRHKGTLAFIALSALFAAAPATAASIPQVSNLDSNQAASPALPEGVDSSDWSSVRDAIQAQRHSFKTTDDGFAARNPRFGWHAQFDGRSALIQPTEGDWSFGFALQAFGFEGELQLVESPEFGACADGQEVSYDWSNELSEWWINDGRGLEHGFTVHERPARLGADEAAPLVFELDTLGSLQPRVNAPQTGLSLHNEEGASVLRYDGLVAFDANGASLSAWIEVEGQSVRICVEEANAAYPILVDPVVQEAYMKASNTDSDDFFGTSIAASGDTIVVGALGESSNSTGVNGDQTNNLALGQAGAVYVFVRSGSSWVQQAYIKPSYVVTSLTIAQRFGVSVDISGDTIVVGSDGDRSGATGVNGDPTDTSANFSGAAYIFVRSGSTWTQQAYLKASNTGQGDFFGKSVSISGNTVVVGAADESSNAVGVNGNQNNNARGESGAAYVFVRTGSTWAQQAFLKASNPDFVARFGNSVDVSGDFIVVGAVQEDGLASGVNGNQLNYSANNDYDSGAAYVFVRTGSTWAQQAYLKASNTGQSDSFGASCAISGDTIVIGAYWEASDANGVNGNQANNGALASGAAYVFDRSGSTWTQQAYLKASNSDAFDRFGDAVAISGDTIVVGARQEDSNAMGVNGNQGSNAFVNSGAAYVFIRSGSIWTQQSYLKASNSSPADPVTNWNDEFGRAVAVAGDTALVGANLEDSNATGLNGNQFDNSAEWAGAVYAFDGRGEFGVVGTPYCQPERNSTNGAGRMSASGSPVVSEQDLTLIASGLPNNATGIFLVGDMSDFVMNPGGSAGNLCIGGNLGRFIGPGQVQNSGANGSFQLELDLMNLPIPTGMVVAGDTWFFQAWHRDLDPMGNVTSNYTDGLEVLFH